MTNTQLTPVGRLINAQVKQEGSQHVVRLYDQHGIELPMWVHGERYEGADYEVMFKHAQAKAMAVAEFINSLCPSARNAMYEAQR